MHTLNIFIGLLLLIQMISSTLLKVNQEMLKEGDCHGLDFQNCINKCKGIKNYKQCKYINKKANCQCE